MFDGATCDECGAHAYVRTVITPTGLDLFWCAHHYRQRMFELMARKYPVTDHRYELEATR